MKNSATSRDSIVITTGYNAHIVHFCWFNSQGSIHDDYAIVREFAYLQNGRDFSARSLRF